MLAWMGIVVRLRQRNSDRWVMFPCDIFNTHTAPKHILHSHIQIGRTPHSYCRITRKGNAHFIQTHHLSKAHRRMMMQPSLSYKYVHCYYTLLSGYTTRQNYNISDRLTYHNTNSPRLSLNDSVCLRITENGVWDECWWLWCYVHRIPLTCKNGQAEWIGIRNWVERHTALSWHIVKPFVTRPERRIQRWMYYNKCIEKGLIDGWVWLVVNGFWLYIWMV